MNSYTLLKEPKFKAKGRVSTPANPSQDAYHNRGQHVLQYNVGGLDNDSVKLLANHLLLYMSSDMSRAQYRHTLYAALLEKRIRVWLEELDERLVETPDETYFMGRKAITLSPRLRKEWFRSSTRFPRGVSCQLEYRSSGGSRSVRRGTIRKVTENYLRLDTPDGPRNFRASRIQSLAAPCAAGSGRVNYKDRTLKIVIRSKVFYATVLITCE